MLSLMVVATALVGADSIDDILAEHWAAQALRPAERCSDEIFLRRVTLDLAGRIPTDSEVRRFRANPSREEKIDELLRSPEFARFWSEVWVAGLNGYTDAFDSDREVMRQWLEQQVADDVPYDKQVTQLLEARGDSALDGPVNFLVRHPSEPAVKVSRFFLGVRLDCARCHDHPFDRWTEEDFRLMNQFFAATRRREVADGNVRLAEVRLDPQPEDRPRFLTGARPRTTRWRSELALFITRSKPFARAYVNRLWYHFLGRGIAHPVDDFNRDNPPAAPELLAYLTERVRSERFALRPMIRLICNSRAYQLESVRSERDPRAEANFAVRVAKPMTVEQTYDSLMVALGRSSGIDERRRFIRRQVVNNLDEDFSATWQFRESVQGLLRRLNQSLPDQRGTVENLYLRFLGRSPTSKERQLCESESPDDIVFALVNSSEFCFNH